MKPPVRRRRRHGRPDTRLHSRILSGAGPANNCTGAASGETCVIVGVEVQITASSGDGELHHARGPMMREEAQRVGELGTSDRRDEGLRSVPRGARLPESLVVEGDDPSTSGIRRRPASTAGTAGIENRRAHRVQSPREAEWYSAPRSREAGIPAPNSDSGHECVSQPSDWWPGCSHCQRWSSQECAVARGQRERVSRSRTSG